MEDKYARLLIMKTMPKEKLDKKEVWNLPDKYYFENKNEV